MLRSLLCAIVAAAAPIAVARTPLQTVPHVDLDRYAGRWYEIATIPAFFQRKCARDTAAEYRSGDDGMLVVVNSCTRVPTAGARTSRAVRGSRIRPPTRGST